MQIDLTVATPSFMSNAMIIRRDVMTVPWHHSSCGGDGCAYEDTIPINFIPRAAALFLTLPRPHVRCQLPSHAPQQLLAQLSGQQAFLPMLFHPSPCSQHPSLGRGTARRTA